MGLKPGSNRFQKFESLGFKVLGSVFRTYAFGSADCREARHLGAKLIPIRNGFEPAIPCLSAGTAMS